MKSFEKLFIIFACLLCGKYAVFAAENRWSWGGPEETRVRTIAISPTNNQVIWIGTIEHGIYRLTDGGHNRQHLDNDLDTNLYILI
jgi:hypothetical protein